MKKLYVLVAGLFLMLMPFSAFGYTVYVEVDSSLQLSNLNALQFDISGGSFNWSDASTSAQVYTSGTVMVNGVSKQAAASAFWLFDKVTTPTIGFSTYDASGGSAPLVPGVLASTTAPNAFTASNFVLGDFSQANGKYPYAYSITTVSFTGGTEYIVSTPVPIPAAVWLLGSGLAGLVFVRRRQKK